MLSRPCVAWSFGCLPLTCLIDENILLTAMSLCQGREYSQVIVRTLSRRSNERSAPLTDAR